jgi:hypothetical protein
MQRLEICRDAAWPSSATQLRDLLCVLLGRRWRGEVRVGGTCSSLDAGDEDGLLESMARASDREGLSTTHVELRAGDVVIELEHDWVPIADMRSGLVVREERRAHFAQFARRRAEIG